ncbi:MAG: 16S rRNA (adenine(1518)-N(6)/adenine(1519)-N(6))-dimethyltransferase RsmA [Eggerthellaceae bacterium]|nr:16S rRNA (adenine(1518)-N(6)/adenine(1519)-N(6))-dimethyltransferase RsmA [Eggerthellaceae bacterium]
MPVTSPLASLKATRAVLDRHGLAAKHALGQNFLVNDGVVAKILTLSGACEEDTVLEVGPGIGTLTTALLPRVGHVIAIERDPELIPVLGETCAPWADRLTLLNRDAMGLTPADLAAAWPDSAPNKFIANLPYVVATALVLDYFRDLPSLESATVMVQREVADRMMAHPSPKEYGAYTVKLALRARATGQFTVQPSSFHPAPKVTSAVIRLDRRQILDETGKPLTEEELSTADMLADAAFATRRKTLNNSFKQYFSGRKDGEANLARAQEAAQAAGVDLARRGETLSPEEFIVLAREFLHSER